MILPAAPSHSRRFWSIEPWPKCLQRAHGYGAGRFGRGPVYAFCVFMLSDNSYLLFHVVSQLKAPPSSCELVRTPKSEVLWVEFLLLHNFHGELTHRVLQIYKSTSLALNCGVEKKVVCISWWFGTNSTHSSCILQTFKALRFSCTRTNFDSV